MAGRVQGAQLGSSVSPAGMSALVFATALFAASKASETRPEEVEFRGDRAKGEKFHEKTSRFQRFFSVRNKKYWDYKVNPKTYFGREWLAKDFMYAAVFGIIHIGAAFAPFYFTWKAFACFLVGYLITGMFGITLSYHRQLSHRSFKTFKVLEYLFAYCGALAMQSHPINWCSSHRHHHGATDTENDVHSPRDGFWWAHAGWLLDQKGTWMRADKNNASDLASQWFYRMLQVTYPLHAIVLPIAGLAWFGGLPCVLWGFFFRVVWVWHVTWAVNSVSHVWGYQDWNTGAPSQNHRLDMIGTLVSFVVGLRPGAPIGLRSTNVGMMRSDVQMKLAEGTLNIGVIGAGRIGLVHLEAIGACSRAVPIIISNPTVSKAEKAASAFPGMEFTGDAMEVINHPDVEAVWICSPSQFHSEQIIACADAGKHVFCEKPIATDLAATVEAVNYCRQKGVKLMTALQRRFDPNFMRCKQAIETGEIGEPIVIKLCSRDPAPPPVEYVKGGGGIFKDMAVHDLDMARFLMGSEPVKVLATGSCQIDKAIEDLEGPEAFDTATVIVRFENGKDAIIDVCRQAKYGYDQRAEVLGMEGMVLSENMQPSTVRKFTGEFVGQADMPYDFFMSRYKEAYNLETNAFIDALLENRPAPCSGRDGLVALVMAMAAGRSAMEQRWVDFGEIIRTELMAGDDKTNFGSLLNSDGKLGENWVRGALLSIERDATSETDLREVFSLWDINGDGFLDEVEMVSFFSKMAVDMTEEEQKACFKAADTSGDGKVSFDEFLVAFKASGQTVREAGESGLKGEFEFKNAAEML